MIHFSWIAGQQTRELRCFKSANLICSVMLMSKSSAVDIGIVYGV